MRRELPVFFHAPHRVMFMAGTVQGVIALAWWAYDLAARYAGLFAPVPWALPPGWIHGGLMMFGFFPFFIFGFAMTAMPRWQGAAPVAGRIYLSSFAFMAAGWCVFYAGLLVRPLLVAGLVLAVLGWLIGLWAILKVMLQPNPNRAHVFIATIAQALGAVCLAAFAAYASGGSPALAQFALTGGIWFYLLPVLVTVVHRMLPFFSGAVIRNYRGERPRWALYALVACFGLHGLLVLAGQSRWTWPVDLAAACVALYLSWLWDLVGSFAARLLAVLHVSFLWLGIALALFAVQSVSQFAGYHILALAPLHALTIGFFASLLIGMASRVTLGHSGRPLAADNRTWIIFWGMQGVAVLRVAADVVELSGPFNLYLVAALAWLVIYVWWGAEYGPIYVKARADREHG